MAQLLGFVQGSTDQSPNRQSKITTQAKIRYTGNQIQNGVISKQDRISNGITHAVLSDVTQSKTEAKHSNLCGKEKVMASFILTNLYVLREFEQLRFYFQFSGLLVGSLECNYWFFHSFLSFEGERKESGGAGVGWGWG